MHLIFRIRFGYCAKDWRAPLICSGMAYVSFAPPGALSQASTYGKDGPKLKAGSRRMRGRSASRTL